MRPDDVLIFIRHGWNPQKNPSHTRYTQTHTQACEFIVSEEVSGDIPRVAAGNVGKGLAVVVVWLTLALGAVAFVCQ